VSEAFSNVAVLFLISLPLMTAGIGWVAATATSRIRYGALVRANHDSTRPWKVAGRTAEGRQSRTKRLVLLRATAAVVVVMAVIAFFLAR
jgi:hypothetical protein